jgi:hypothetical protein
MSPILLNMPVNTDSLAATPNLPQLEKKRIKRKKGEKFHSPSVAICEVSASLLNMPVNPINLVATPLMKTLKSLASIARMADAVLST